MSESIEPLWTAVRDVDAMNGLPGGCSAGRRASLDGRRDAFLFGLGVLDEVAAAHPFVVDGELAAHPRLCGGAR
jgi:hypothetical protein